jgi:RHS repeat-associated protein
VNASYTYESVAPVTGKLQTATQNGNTVTYGYDMLGRLTSAGSTAWNQTYTYDGFSNLYRKTGSTGTMDWSGSLNAEKNQIGSYDMAGNVLGYTWDADNRLIYNPAYQKYYVYDLSNQRVIEFVDGNDYDTAVVTFRAGGKMLGRYTYQVNVTGTLTGTQEFKYLAGRRTDAGSDRLGSDVSGRVLLPYGEELTPTANGATKFATYWRDGDTGLDYADQRYYVPGQGRFLTADPYTASGGTTNPSSWNRYAYVEGDPINFNDPQGLFALAPHDFGFSGELLVNILGFQRSLGYPATPREKIQSRAEAGLAAVTVALENAVATQSVFTTEQLECISGIETGRTWNPNVRGSNSRAGLFQFDEQNWRASGTSIPWDGGANARDPEISATVALALLFRKLGYDGVGNPTDDAIQKAIDNYGEGDGRYGRAVMECANELKRGSFQTAFDVLDQYATWVRNGRP